MDQAEREARSRIKNMQINIGIFDCMLVEQLGEGSRVVGANIEIDTRSIILCIQSPKFDPIQDGEYIPRIHPWREEVNSKTAFSFRLD